MEKPCNSQSTYLHDRKANRNLPSSGWQGGRDSGVRICSEASRRNKKFGGSAKQSLAIAVKRTGIKRGDKTASRVDPYQNFRMNIPRKSDGRDHKGYQKSYPDYQKQSMKAKAGGKHRHRGYSQHGKVMKARGKPGCKSGKKSRRNSMAKRDVWSTRRHGSKARKGGGQRKGKWMGNSFRRYGNLGGGANWNTKGQKTSTEDLDRALDLYFAVSAVGKGSGSDLKALDEKLMQYMSGASSYKTCGRSKEVSDRGNFETFGARDDRYRSARGARGGHRVRAGDRQNGEYR